jgi:N-acetylmuramoyl-L-alanine amidase
MAKRIWIALAAGGMLAGCLYEKEAAPRVISSPVLQNPAPRPAPAPVVRTPPEPASPDVPAAWIPPAGQQRRWTAIVIHHSATPTGNAAIFDRWHREGRQWDGIGYDFVIGNGSDSPDGAVEVTFRWTQQRTGAHTGGTPNNWANEEAVGICLVGDFSQSRPTAAQLQSLAALIRFLEARYDIPPGRIYGHGTTPGARATDCPGSGFPMAELFRRLETQAAGPINLTGSPPASP